MIAITMSTIGGSSGAIHASANTNAGGASGNAGGNPRKFSEKIHILTMKGAEDTTEFEKIMSECAALKTEHQTGDKLVASDVRLPRVINQYFVYTLPY